MLTVPSIWFALLALIASIINGGIGYGFSSIITPIAVLFVSNKILNPALVICELGVNLVLLFVERRNIRSTWRRSVPMIAGLAPGVIVGSYALSIVSPTLVKIALYVVLLPLIFLQLLGRSWPVRKEHYASPIIGGLIGLLYSLTTVSGPPLAMFWRNQGLVKDEFRCVIAQVRVAEASFTTASYFALGLFTPTSTGLIPYFIIPVVVGIPIGVFLLRRMSPGLFRTIVMAADGIIVSFGLGNILGAANYVPGFDGYIIFALGTLLVLGVTAKVIRKSKREGVV